MNQQHIDFLDQLIEKTPKHTKLATPLEQIKAMRESLAAGEEKELRVRYCEQMKMHVWLA